MRESRIYRGRSILSCCNCTYYTLLRYYLNVPELVFRLSKCRSSKFQGTECPGWVKRRNSVPSSYSARWRCHTSVHQSPWIIVLVYLKLSTIVLPYSMSLSCPEIIRRRQSLLDCWRLHSARGAVDVFVNSSKYVEIVRCKKSNRPREVRKRI